MAFMDVAGTAPTEGERERIAFRGKEKGRVHQHLQGQTRKKIGKKGINLLANIDLVLSLQDLFCTSK